MKKLLLPLILLMLGAGLGTGAGVMLRPEPEDHAALPECAPPTPDAHEGEDVAHLPEDDPEDQAHEYVKLNNQFVIPVLEQEKVTSLVVLSLSLETPVGAKEGIFQLEPKIRDAFLQVLFDHANAGGFSGAFTQNRNMTVLRNALLEVARKTVGRNVTDVLISDIVRQDL